MSELRIIARKPVTFVARQVAAAALVIGPWLEANKDKELSDIGGAVWDTARTGHANVGTFGQFLDAAVSSRSVYAGGAVASVTAPVTVADKTGFSLSATGFDAVLVEGSINARQALSGILAAAAGVVAGAGSGTVIIKAAGGTTTRITAQTDNAGNRTTVVLALPT